MQRYQRTNDELIYVKGYANLETKLFSLNIKLMTMHILSIYYKCQTYLIDFTLTIKFVTPCQLNTGNLFTSNEVCYGIRFGIVIFYFIIEFSFM